MMERNIIEESKDDRIKEKKKKKRKMIKNKNRNRNRRKRNRRVLYDERRKREG